MRKLFVLPIVFASILANFGAFAANARGGRGATNATNNNAVSAPVAARAAVRGAQKASAVPANKTTSVAARAAVRGTQKTATATTAVSAGNVAARAGSKQKVINMGTKIASATANTVVSQECQDAYFGCMDSFCMLENTAGGRCKCSDKSIEYDAMLAEIQNKDQQSYMLQTEGVSLLKMGKSADDVYAMAQQAADKVMAEKKKDTETTKKPKVDLSLWDNDLFGDAEIFEEEGDVLIGDLTARTGDKMHATAAKICTNQVPTQCKSAVQMLRMVYAQKIESDCAAYQNGLKQQQLESDQKLLAARQSLRDTALEKFEEENKYKTAGDCAAEFGRCMQREENCGQGFKSCVTFSAQDNMTKGQTKQKTLDGFQYSRIKLAASTMDQLLSKKPFCDSVLDQCVKVKDQVWNVFLNSFAPTIKTAEIDVETDLRNNCVSEITKCFRDGCAERMDPNSDGDQASYDMCLSNPELLKSLCKPKLEPCLLATGGTYDDAESSILWQSVLAALASYKVDVCTTEIKDCLLSEDRCGKDYSKCIGLNSSDIIDLCPYQKLTACMSEKKDADTVREYVVQVAQGIALDIDEGLSKACESALTEAMYKYCGDTTTCPNAVVDDNVFKDVGLSVQFCEKKTDWEASHNGQTTTDDEQPGWRSALQKAKDALADAKATIEELKNAAGQTGVAVDARNEYVCKDDIYSFSDEDMVGGKVMPRLVNQVDMASLYTDMDFMYAEREKFEPVDANAMVFNKLGGENYKSPDQTMSFYNEETLDKIIRTMNSNFRRIVNTIESDPKITYCTSGRKVQGFEEGTFITKNSTENPRYPNLTRNIRSIIANDLLASADTKYYEIADKIRNEQYEDSVKKLSERLNEIVKMTQAEQDVINAGICENLRYTYMKDPEPHFTTGKQKNTTNAVYSTYDSKTSMCTVKKYTWKCSYQVSGICWDWKTDLDSATLEFETEFPLPTVTKSAVMANGKDDALIMSEKEYFNDLGLKKKK